MIKKYSLALILIFSLVSFELASAGAKVIKVSGNVTVRRGVEETWQPVLKGMELEDIDTILTGADGIITLETSAGRRFELRGNAILDISDLREISEKELFVFLMENKLKKIEPRKGKTPLRIGNVSVVHGLPVSGTDSASKEFSEPDLWNQEKNGARTLYGQEFYPNSIMKYHKILDKYDEKQDCGEIHFYLGKSLEALNQTGQAIDAYQEAINRYKEEGCENANAKSRLAEAKQAIDRLKPKK